MIDTIFIQLCNNRMVHLGLDSKKLSLMTDINYPALNMVLAGKVRASLPIALKLAQVLDVSLDSLTNLNRKAGGLQ